MSLEHSSSKDNGIDSLRVIPDKEMPGLLNISPATWERSKKAGDRPAVTQLSARRIGYAQTLDPYGVYPDLPEECQQVGNTSPDPRKRHRGR